MSVAPILDLLQVETSSKSSEKQLRREIFAGASTQGSASSGHMGAVREVASWMCVLREMIRGKTTSKAKVQVEVNGGYNSIFRALESLATG